MKKLKLSLLVVLAVALSLTACKKEEDTVVAKNIVELAQGNSNLSSLVAAVTKAGLADELSASGTFTVFAPTDSAFARFLRAKGYANLDAVPNAVLEKILLNHVLGVKKKAADITTGYVKTIGKYGTTASFINMYLNTASGVKINGTSKVITADIEASNGIVHVVDEVIDLPTVVTFAIADAATFSTLVAALTDSRIADANLVSTLSGTGPFTVFAPTNAAFTSLLDELDVTTGLPGIGASTLESVLKYHVVAGANVLAGSLTEGQVVTTFLDQTFKIGLTGGPKITDASTRVSNIIVTDVQASNGVIHVIDKVLLPLD